MVISLNGLQSREILARTMNTAYFQEMPKYTDIKFSILIRGICTIKFIRINRDDLMRQNLIRRS